MVRLRAFIAALTAAYLAVQFASGQDASPVSAARAAAPRHQGRRLLEEMARERGEAPPERGMKRDARQARAITDTPSNQDFAAADPFKFPASPAQSQREPLDPTSNLRQDQRVQRAAYQERIPAGGQETKDLVDLDPGDLDSAEPSTAVAEQPSQPAAAATVAPGPPPVDPPVANRTVDGIVQDGVIADTDSQTEARVERETDEALALAPRSDPQQDSGQESAAAADGRTGDDQGSPLSTMFGSLALVLALFFAVVWVMRRAMPASQRPLPLDAVEVLGRVPLPGRQQQMQLVRCGSRLLLLATSTSGVQPLTEITDADEVDRMLRLCRGERCEGLVAPQSRAYEGLGALANRRLEEPVETAATALARRLGRSARREGSDV